MVDRKEVFRRLSLHETNYVVSVLVFCFLKIRTHPLSNSEEVFPLDGLRISDVHIGSEKSNEEIRVGIGRNKGAATAQRGDRLTEGLNQPMDRPTNSGVLSWKKLHVPLVLDHMLSPLGGKKQPVTSNLFQFICMDHHCIIYDKPHFDLLSAQTTYLIAAFGGLLERTIFDLLGFYFV